MSDDLLEPRMIHMPPLAPGRWLNVEKPLASEQLIGKIVMLDFWDYTCVNCLRTLPYVLSWHRRYAPHGLLIIGIHSPEFKFAQARYQVERAIDEFGIPYPVLQDNDFVTWDRFAVKAWPTKILIDQDGYIRFQRQGEGHYRTIETALQQLLRNYDPSLQMPPLLEPFRPEDSPGAVCYRPTPEVYAGIQGGGLFAGGLGNPEGYATQGPAYYKLPPRRQRQEGALYLDGLWRTWPDALAYAGTTMGTVTLPFRASEVNAVISPSADPVETALGIPATGEPIVEVRLNGKFVGPDHAGLDVAIDESGRSYVYIDRPRMYQLVRNPAFIAGELTLSFCGTGLALYSFTFSGCVVDKFPPAKGETYQVR